MQSFASINLSIMAFFTFGLSVSSSFGAQPAKPGPAPATAPVKCSQAPESQFVNNAGIKIHEVKISNVVFQENLSPCLDGCSTGFKAVAEGQNQIQVKTTPLASWLNLGSLGKFEKCTHYTVNLIKKDKNLCAELYTRKNTVPILNNDPAKQKIGETCQSVPLLTVPEKATSVSAPPRVQTGANAPGSAPAATMPPTPEQMQTTLPKPSFDNMYFKQATTEQGDAMRMSAPGRLPGTGSDSTESVPTIRADLGDELLFNCGFSIKNVNVDTLRVHFYHEGESSSGGSNHPSQLRNGSCTDSPGGGKYYRFQNAYRPERGGLLTMRVTAIGPGGTVHAEKQVRIDLRMPVLELLNPEFNNDTREVTFKVKNTGDMTFPAGSGLELVVDPAGLPKNEPIVHRLTDIKINRDQIVRIGPLAGIFPESSRNLNPSQMHVTLRYSCRVTPWRESEYQFTHTFPVRTTVIRNVAINGFGGFDGDIEINTYKSCGGDRCDTQPYVADDSRFSLSDPDNESVARVTRPIAIEWFRFGSDGTEAYVYINKLDKSDLGDLFIRNGKIVMRFHFPIKNTLNEGMIKVWARDAIGKCWRDNWLPDLDWIALSVELELTPVLDGQNISYSAVTARADVNLDGPGNSIEKNMESAVASKLESSFVEVFNHAEIKAMFSNKFTQKVRIYVDNRYWWDGVHGEGSTLVLTHR